MLLFVDERYWRRSLNNISVIELLYSNNNDVYFLCCRNNGADFIEAALKLQTSEVEMFKLIISN
jgi:hypothetical protein